MEFYNSKIRNQFIKIELRRSFFDFPIEMDRAYSKTRQNLRRILHLYKNQKIDGIPKELNNEEDKENTALEFSSLVPTHTLKMYAQLLKCEETMAKNKFFFALDKPIIHLIDIGCGGGSSSIALLMLLNNYQKFRIDNYLPLYPVCVNLLGIDPNPHALIIYNQFIAETAKEITQSLISIKYNIINGKLADKANDVLSWLLSYKVVNSCIFTFENVIRPYKAEFSNQSTKQKPVIRKGNLLNKPEFIGKSDIETINSILKHVTIDRAEIIVVSSPTNATKGYPANNWLIETREFFNHTANKFEKDSHYILKKNNIKESNINILGPKDCYFRKIKNRHEPVPIKFNAGFLYVVSKQYLEIQKEWEKILDLDNLLLAWARVRNEMTDATLEDTLEIRLFEINIKDRLEQLRCRLISYDFESLGVDKMINYLVPKGHGKAPRPMSICRLEEQILSVSILQFKAREYADLPGCSYAYRLSTNVGKENLYYDWFQTHQNFIKSARQAAEKTPDYQVIQTDLSSYYTMIRQNTLLKEVCHHGRLEDNRFMELARRLIIRDCDINSPDNGIPQGHVLSGALSNIYLLPIDRLFAYGNKWGLSYFRYVDDMIFIFPGNITSQDILEALDNELGKLGLRRSTEKTTEVMPTVKFLKITNSDSDLDDLGRDFNYLLADLYKLNRSHYQLLMSDWWKFIDHYQKVLWSIGCYISTPRLSRKIKQNLRWWDSLKYVFIPSSSLPIISGFDDLENIENWKMEFVDWSPGWIKNRLEIHTKIKELFGNALFILSEPGENEEAKGKAKKKFKFAINRLGKLGFDEYTDTIIFTFR